MTEFQSTLWLMILVGLVLFIWHAQKQKRAHRERCNKGLRLYVEMQGGRR